MAIAWLRALAVLSLLLFGSCAGAGPSGSDSAEAPATAATKEGQTPVPNPRKLIKTVDLELRVADTSATGESLKALAAESGGYLSEMTAYRRGDLPYFSLTLRVPVDRLDEIVARIKKLADRVERESVRTEDVTDRFVDLEARLATLNGTETELRNLLAESRERQQKAEDVMAIYKNLTEIRGNIEQIQGQLKSLESLSSLSTIHVELIPTEGARPIVAQGWSPGDTARSSSRALMTILQGLADFCIALAIVGLPLFAMFGLPAWAVAALWRRSRRRRSTEVPVEVVS